MDQKIGDELDVKTKTTIITIIAVIFIVPTLIISSAMVLGLLFFWDFSDDKVELSSDQAIEYSEEIIEMKYGDVETRLVELHSVPIDKNGLAIMWMCGFLVGYQYNETIDEVYLIINISGESVKKLEKDLDRYWNWYTLESYYTPGRFLDLEDISYVNSENVYPELYHYYEDKIDQRLFKFVNWNGSYWANNKWTLSLRYYLNGTILRIDIDYFIKNQTIVDPTIEYYFDHRDRADNIEDWLFYHNNIK